MSSHSPDQPEATVLHFFLLLYTGIQMKNSAVYSFLTDIGLHPSLVFETAQDRELSKQQHLARWKGTKPMNYKPLSIPKGQNLNSK